jgi:uncharacterized protein YfaS (alpha-2-macroglobulin family)
LQDLNLPWSLQRPEMISLPAIQFNINQYSRFDVSGKILGVTGLDAFIYPERDIYRRWVIHYSVIVRDYSWKSPGEIPVKLKFTPTERN